MGGEGEGRVLRRGSPKILYLHRTVLVYLQPQPNLNQTPIANSYASVYQMLRGTLVLFAGAFTVVILRRRLFSHHWLGMVLITAGAALVGASSIIYAQEDADGGSNGSNNGASLGGRLWRAFAHGPGGGAAAGATSSAAGAPLFGDILVVCAQAFNALQFILEEKFLVKYKVPALLAVGIEGCWGLLLCAVALPVLSFVKAGDGLPVDDAAGAVREIAAHGQLAAAIALSVVSIACFNFFGGLRGGGRERCGDYGQKPNLLNQLSTHPPTHSTHPLNPTQPAGISVTKSLSGAARATIDACRTLFIWLVCVRLGWERFHALQIVGFVVLICGSALYNEILRSCLPGGGAAEGAEGGDGGSGDEARRRQRRGASSNYYRGGPSRGSRSRSRLADEEAGEGDLSAPLLQQGLAAAAVPIATAAGGAHGHGHGGAAQQGARRPGGRQAEPRVSVSPGSEDLYVFARSMRLGPGALFPSSLGGSIPQYLEEGDDGGSPSGTSQDGGSYSYGRSSYRTGLLGGYTSGGETPPAYSYDDASSSRSPAVRGAAAAPGQPAARGGGSGAAAGGGVRVGGGAASAGQVRPGGGAATAAGAGRGPGVRGGLAAAMRRGGGGSGNALSDLARAAASPAGQQQQHESSSGGGRPPPGRSGMAPRPASGSGGPPSNQ